MCTDNLKLKQSSKDLDVDGRIILNISWKKGLKITTEFIWLSILPSDVAQKTLINLLTVSLCSRTVCASGSPPLDLDDSATLPGVMMKSWERRRWSKGASLSQNASTVFKLWDHTHCYQPLKYYFHEWRVFVRNKWHCAIYRHCLASTAAHCWMGLLGKNLYRDCRSLFRRIQLSWRRNEDNSQYDNVNQNSVTVAILGRRIALIK
jgi:hypothetical protein